MYYINVYSVERMYGGPEEGGWWYDLGEPVLSRKTKSYRKAVRMAERLKKRWPKTDSRYSVLGGEDYSIYIENKPAKMYPESIPHYE